MKPLFLFVRPPRPRWPYNGPETSFWPPLAFASLAAALREAVPDVEVRILDAPTLHLGWRTLATRLNDWRPRWVGIGEEAVSGVEGLRLARLAKAVGARVIAGGCFFSHVAEPALRSGWADAVVHGEGEVTLVDLMRRLADDAAADLRTIPGLSFVQAGEVIFTGHRPLIEDLDSLPMPAYDLLPVERYGEHSRNHPAFAAIELGRGCVDACSFCVLWRQMGHFHGNQLTPRLRVKSPGRLLEEIRVLERRYHRRYLGWVDPCFNAHPDVPRQVAEGLLREGLKLGQSAWVRADGLLRDEASGALATCVSAGLNEIYVGIERPDDEGLRALDKRQQINVCHRALARVADRFPEVFVVGSFIYGLPGDTPATIRRIYALSLELALDKAFFIPLTPLPGTAFWSENLWDDTGQGFRRYNFLPGSGVGGSRPELERALLRCFALDWRPARWCCYWRGLTHGGGRKRRLTCRLFARSTGHVARLIWHSVSGRGDDQGMILPAWYED